MRGISALAAVHRPDFIVAVEARGFPFGAAMGLGLVPVRKAGKLPRVTIGVDFQLKYGVDRLGQREGAVVPGHRVVLVDDLLATGGTILAAADLMRSAGARWWPHCSSSTCPIWADRSGWQPPGCPV